MEKIRISELGIFKETHKNWKKTCTTCLYFRPILNKIIIMCYKKDVITNNNKKYSTKNRYKNNSRTDKARNSIRDQPIKKFLQS